MEIKGQTQVMFKDIELKAILDELPKLPESFSKTLTDVNRTQPNAKVFVNERLQTLEIFPTIGGGLSTPLIDLSADLAPFCD